MPFALGRTVCPFLGSRAPQVSLAPFVPLSRGARASVPAPCKTYPNSFPRNISITTEEEGELLDGEHLLASGPIVLPALGPPKRQLLSLTIAGNQGAAEDVLLVAAKAASSSRRKEGR